MSTAANVNDGPMLSLVLNSLPIVRSQPARAHPHHLCLDVAFDNAPAREVIGVERYTGHIAPKGGRAPDAVVHPGAKHGAGRSSARTLGMIASAVSW